MTLTKALAAATILSMAATPVHAAKANNSAAKLSLEQPNVYPPAGSANRAPSRAGKASKMTVPLIVAGVAVVVGAAVLLGQNDSTPASR